MFEIKVLPHTDPRFSDQMYIMSYESVKTLKIKFRPSRFFRANRFLQKPLVFDTKKREVQIFIFFYIWSIWGPASSSMHVHGWWVVLKGTLTPAHHFLMYYNGNILGQNRYQEIVDMGNIAIFHYFGRFSLIWPNLRRNRRFRRLLSQITENRLK